MGKIKTFHITKCSMNVDWLGLAMSVTDNLTTENEHWIAIWSKRKDSDAISSCQVWKLMYNTVYFSRSLWRLLFIFSDIVETASHKFAEHFPCSVSCMIILFLNLQLHRVSQSFIEWSQTDRREGIYKMNHYLFYLPMQRRVAQLWKLKPRPLDVK